MDVYEQTLRAFCTEAVRPLKFVDDKGEPVSRYIRLTAGRTEHGSRKFTDRVPIEIEEDPEELSDRLIGLCALKRKEQNCYALLYKTGANRYKSAAELPQQHPEAEAGTTLQKMMTKDGLALILERDPIAQLTAATGAAINMAVRSIERTNEALLSDGASLRRQNAALIERTANLEAIVWVQKQLLPEEAEENPYLKAMMVGLGKLEKPINELMVLGSVLVQQKAGVADPKSANERAGKNGTDPTDDNTMDAEFEEADETPMSDEDYKAELAQLMEQAIEVAMLRPHLVDLLMAAKLLPVVNAAGIKIESICPVCIARGKSKDPK